MKTKIYIFLLLPMVLPHSLLAHETCGRTYSIAEKDAITEMKQAASRVNWKKIMTGKTNEDKIRNYKPKNLEKLPQTKQRNQFYTDMTYTLPYDIPDGKGSILYPKGYTFNPLDYTNLHEILIFIDGTKKKQVQWFKTSGYANRLGVKLLITAGNYYTLGKTLNQSVFYADKTMIDRFQLEHVPSIVNQINNKMLVTEIGL
jgi:conjugal transfer pilus assembly protein TraW